MADNPLKTLDAKIDELIALCAELNRENRALKDQNAGWQQERRELIEQNSQARSRIQAVLERLRAMEQAS